MDWQAIWNSIVNFFKSNAWNILWFFVILLVGIIVIKIVLRLVKKLFSRTKIEKMAQQFVITILKFVLYLALVLLLLSQIGVEISGILTACSAVILAVGMALQNSISNVANGIIIISNKMFKKGDYIITGGVEGQVTDINFLFTTLITTDNKKITLPNSNILNGEVTNLGAYPTRRVDFMFSVAYETDVELVKKIVTDVMKSDGRVLLDPAPFCRLKVLGASSIDFAANCWCDNSDYWDVYYYVIENVYNEFKRNNVSIPYNQLEIRERKDNVVMPVTAAPLQERVEKIREIEEERFDFEHESLAKFLHTKHKNRKEQEESAEEQPKTEDKQ
ncbi:MAG: mechanosensitive ion channel [Clostridia bacterium]|nr:mechanosensitive ion channel [Clostridia bacterium]